jgi:ubiquitin-like modifier-activating enzyme ATG7
MLLRAFNDTAYLEQLTGLDQLYKESEELMEAADWGAGEGSGEDDF